MPGIAKYYAIIDIESYGSIVESALIRLNVKVSDKIKQILETH